MNTTQDIFTPEGLRTGLLLLMEKQHDLMRETGVCQSQISFFISGKRKLAAKAILRLLDFYLNHKGTHTTEKGEAVCIGEPASLMQTDNSDAT